MGLSRLDNFLKSSRGTILYVDPNSLDSTDSIENSGNSLTRPFKTLQRALIEAARFSYQRGQGNDRFNKTTILLYPGDHIVDNRPGYIPTGSGTYSSRSGATGLTDLTQWDLDTIFDLSSPDNPLYKLNSVHGGIIVPRGTSIVGMDLRKTRIRPLYVPNPENSNIERSCVLRTTGACYFWQFTILDADPNGNCYKDYTDNLFVPNFSHHKLSGFEYADGINGVYIDDDFLNGGNKVDTTRTDLDMYYEKVAVVYGPSSGREITPDYGDGIVDIQPVVDEYRIVGSKGASVGISSIRAGDGTVLNATTTITVDLVEPLEGISVDTPIQISGISAKNYDGQYVVRAVDASSTQITYQTQNVPENPNPTTTGATLDIVVDTVTSASPYIFNVSLRSVYGMCGLLADGDKATGFKSMVVAQFTGIGLQKDDNAFVRYDTGSGEYKDSTSIANLHTNSRSKFKPSYENFHIKATNDAFLQLVSVFAIGYAQHFVAENGGDLAINNSNSNFGSKALVSSGFKREAFAQDDYGYITHIIPPKEIETSEITVEFASIDVGLTTSKSAGSASTDRLYLYSFDDLDNPPQTIIDGYHVGAKRNEELKVQIFQNEILTTYSSTIMMPYGPYNSTQSSSEKIFNVGRSIAGINSITTNTLTLTEDHSFINGESIRIIADDGHIPDGLTSNQVYYAITKESDNTLGTNQIKIAKTLNEAISSNEIQINSKGGLLSVVSRVSDKNAGDIGHPVQWDGSAWYVTVSTSNNLIYDIINTSGTENLGQSTPRTYFIRKPDDRNLIDTFYRVRYILPKDSISTARPPTEGFILQESNNIIGQGESEISQLYNTSGSISSNSTLLRNSRFIANASYSLGSVTIRSEIPHQLKVGDEVEIVNVLPTEYNGTYTVTSVPSAKEFTYDLNSDPGTFAKDTSNRSETLPYFKKKKYSKTYQVYKVQEVQEYVPNLQDGIYYLTILNCSNSPTVTPFTDNSYIQSIENLYPQTNPDNPSSDPDATVSHVLSDNIGQVVVNDYQNSITKETLESFVVGYGITDICSSSGTAHTIYTTLDHGFSGITSVSIVSGGSAYGTGSVGDLYNAQLVGFAGSTTGSNATAKITINGSGTITSIKIIDGGSAYGVGNTLTVVGVATTTSHVVGVVRVTSVSNNIGDSIKVSGVSSSLYSGYNTLYRISGISTGKSKELDVVSSETVSNTTSSGLGITITSNSGYIPTGKVLQISTLVYDTTTGLATAGFSTSHGFKVDNKIRIGGATETEFNGDFIVKRLNSLSSLVLNVGVGIQTTFATGTLYAYGQSLTSYGGELRNDTENTSGRLIYQYAGITTVLGTQYSIQTSDSTDLNIPNAVSLGFNLGDYLLINDEIFRIKTAVTSNSVSIFRSVLGSPRQTHQAGSVVRRIKVTPVELRRNSIVRASAHTFEYLGFGPGNYSTALPEKQDRNLTVQEKLLAQSTRINGGIVVYTGMNNEGDFFSGNKKINSTTGKEETYDTPVSTRTGEKNINTLVNITDTQKLFVENSIKVDGGADKTSVSYFDGPVIFNNKVSAYSDIESNSILIQGEEEVSRKLSILNQEPTESGNYGDIYFNSQPRKNDFIGWTYVTENEWEPFGWIGYPGVGIASGGNYVGFSTLINIVATGFTFTVDYDSVSGISTLTLDGNPRVAITTGAFAQNLVGLVTTINFVGALVNVSGSPSGIATVSIEPVSLGGSLPGLPYNSLQWNNNGVFDGASNSYYDEVNNILHFGSYPNQANTLSITNDGKLGLSTYSPSAKVEIVSDNETSLYIKTTAGNDIVKIENGANDTSPFVIKGDGSIGINTDNTLAALDVVGNAAVTGSIRLYETDRTNYVGFGVSSLTENYLYTLPNSYGVDGQVLTTDGLGVLSWETYTGGNIVSAGTGVTITYDGQNATISNAGVTKIIAGSGVTISPSTGTGDVTISASGGGATLYPFTTRGFGMVL